MSQPFRDWASKLPEWDTLRESEDNVRWREEWDAVHTALDLAGITPPDEALVDDGPADDETAGPLHSLIHPDFITAGEDDLLAVDLQRFDRNGSIRLVAPSVARFTDARGDFNLTIVNVNRKVIEHALGVDLLYVDEGLASVTMIQYKRLRQSGSGDWAYFDRADLDEQLAKMRIVVSESSNARNWRLNSDPFWFKFAKADSFRASDTMVLRGMYVPAGLLRVAVADGSLTGKRGGFALSSANLRHLTREHFVNLVRAGFTGTTEEVSAQIFGVAAQASTQRQLVLALKARAEVKSVVSRE